MTLKANLLAISLSLLAILLSAQESPVSQINGEITQRKIKGHLSYLASDALQGRDTGSQGQKAAAAYIATRLMAYGVDTIIGYGDYLQNVPMIKAKPPHQATLTIENKTLSYPDDFLVLHGVDGRSDSPVLFVNDAEDPTSWVGVDAKQKIIVTTAGSEESQDVGTWIGLTAEKRKHALKAGAIGLIEIYQNSTVPWTLLKRMGTREQIKIDDRIMGENAKASNSFTHIWLSAQDSTAIKSLREGKEAVNIKIEGMRQTPIHTANVIGMVEGTDPQLKDEYIVYGAHYDHVGIGRADATGDTIYNGARDNAVGSTAVLSMAEYISAHPTKRSALFVFFTGEEKGLLGSKYFVDHSPIPLHNIKYCYNIDNGGYNDTTIISVVGLTRTTAEDIIQNACNTFGVKAIEDAAGEQGLFDRSDNVNFAKKGIPAPTFSLGFTAFDQEIFKYYHQPADEVGSLNMNYIEKYVKSYILSGIHIANAYKAPQWRVGDKYFEAGKRLYNNN